MALFEARNLSFAYKDVSMEDIFRDVNFSLEAEEIYDLRGSSGAGKTTLLKVCSRLLPLQSGRLLLEGVDAQEFSPQEWRARVSLLPQKTMLQTGSIRDNLLLPFSLKVNASATVPSDAELSRLLKLACLDMDLDRDASQLSGGQATRIALLRLCVLHPKVFLLDEVDSGLDDETALAIGQLTHELVHGGASCLRIRHRGDDAMESGVFSLQDGKVEFETRPHVHEGVAMLKEERL